MGSAAGYLMLVKPADATEEMLSLRRISGLALVVSVVALWDGLLVTANLPITIGFWVFPAWLVSSSRDRVFGWCLSDPFRISTEEVTGNELESHAEI